ncbi:hypothetical protein ACLI4Q_18685 [Natrialbaceae archaeon A-CW1-1]
MSVEIFPDIVPVLAGFFFKRQRKLRFASEHVWLSIDQFERLRSVLEKEVFGEQCPIIVSGEVWITSGEIDVALLETGASGNVLVARIQIPGRPFSGDHEPALSATLHDASRILHVVNEFVIK